MQTKLYAALVLPPVAASLFIPPAESTPGPHRLRRECLALIVGALVPFAAWEAVEFVATGWSVHAWIGLKARELAFIDAESGLGAFREAASLGRMLRGQVSQHVAALVDNFNGWPSLALFPAALAVSVGAVSRMPATDARSAQIRRAVFLLLAAAAIHLAWWCLGESQSWYRHLLPAVVYSNSGDRYVRGSARSSAERKDVGS